MTATVSHAAILHGILTMCGDGGRLKIYTDPMPIAGQAHGSAVLLGTVLLTNPAGVVLYDTPGTAWTLGLSVGSPDTFTDADGIATWGRLEDSVGTWIMDMDVSNYQGSGAIKMLNTQMYAGGTLTIGSAILSVPD